MIEVTYVPIPSHFTKSEIACNCGCGLCIIDYDFLLRLELARRISTVPFIITSWCRCQKHNIEIGGVAMSKHLQGQAVDIHIPSPSHFRVVLPALLAAGFTFFGIGADFVHVNKQPALPEQHIFTYDGERGLLEWQQKIQRI